MNIKKLLCIALGVVLASSLAFASSAQVITSGIRSINETGFAEAMRANATNGGVMLAGRKITDLAALGDLSVRPGESLTIRLTANMFLKQGGLPLGTAADTVSSALLDTTSIETRVVTARGEGLATTDINTDRNGAFIEVAFAKSLANLNKTFSYSVYLAQRGARRSATRINLKGRVKTDVIEVEAGTYWADTSNGDGIKPLANIREFEFDLGSNVSITRSVTRGRTYYGMASRDSLEIDAPLYTKYPDLIDVYRLQTVNMKTGGNIVYLYLDDEYHVYNSNGLYLGTSEDALPYWTTYYITTEQYPYLAIN